MNETDIEKEAKLELAKNTEEMMKDAIREANSPREELDNIKHLIKRLAIHQVVLEERTNKTNNWLKWLTVILVILSLIMAVGAGFSIATYFK